MDKGEFLAKAGRKIARQFRHHKWTRRFLVKYYRHWCPDEDMLTRSIYGFRMYASPHDYMSYSAYFLGYMEYTNSEFFNWHVREGDVCWDVGANIGYFTLLMAARTRSSGRVDAFEPFPPVYEKLERNIALNNFTWVNPVSRAASDQNGTMQFVLPEFGISPYASERTQTMLQDCGGVGYLKMQEQEGVQTVDVDVTTLDEYAAETNLQRLDVMKMDIEGAELTALKGMQNTIETMRPVIAIEYNYGTSKRAGHSVQEVDQALNDLGYDRYAYFARLKQINVSELIDRFGAEMVINIYCFPRERAHRL